MTRWDGSQTARWSWLRVRKDPYLMLVTWDVIKLVFEQLARLERRGEETWENRGGREEIIKERKKRKEKKRKERKKKRKQGRG